MDKSTIEKRSYCRNLESSNETIGGYAAVFYRDGDSSTEYQLAENVKERVSRNAFDRLLASNDDVIVTFDHDFKTLLGRRSSGTLSLSVDNIGLRWSVPYDADDDDHRKIKRKIDKGDIRGCSFAFGVEKESWSTEGKNDIRSLDDVSVFELGPVINPAFSGATTRNKVDTSEAMQSHLMYETDKIISDIKSIIEEK